jgi:Uma2 family endonuclease
MVSAIGQEDVQGPGPLYFPVEAKVPESKRHYELRTALYQILSLAFGDRAAIGCDQFVYWDPTDPSACLAPDAFVRLEAENDQFDTWKVWERGAPHLAVEIVSHADTGQEPWKKKLAKYRRLGVKELVRFDPEELEAPLEVWDERAGDLVPRRLADPRTTECSVLGLVWVVIDEPLHGIALRLQTQEAKLLPTPTELAAEASEARAREVAARARAEADRDRVAAERDRVSAERDRAAAELNHALERVRALEEELKRRS